jgi:hypothetical protein
MSSFVYADCRVQYSKISLHFCKDFRIFCEGKWEIKDNGNAIIKQRTATSNNPDAGKKQGHENTNNDNARALSTTFPTLHNRMTPSLSLKFIVESFSERAQFAPTTFQAFKLIVTLTSIVDFQLVVELNLIPHFEGA